jgi:hypothetical protein
MSSYRLIGTITNAEVVAVGPPTDYTQIQIDFGWGEALHGPHTLALATRLIVYLLARIGG